MAQTQGAGPLRELLMAESRSPIDDGMGNEISGPWTEQSLHPASLVARRGGEAVIAGRLQGTVSFVATARYSMACAAISTDYRFRSTRSGQTYSILTAIARPGRDYIDFDVVTGVAE